jgi:diacylglycerol kinase
MGVFPQPNFQVHGVLSVCAILLTVILGCTAIETTIIVLTIVMGLSAEMINTAIESVTDLVTKEWHTDAKIAKDVAAGMMLLTAMGTVLVACLIFLPKIYLLLFV